MVRSAQLDNWVAAAQRGDRLALTKALAVIHPQLHTRADARMPVAMKARSDPDDILQEVYIDVARQIRQFENRGTGSFQNWVRVILDRKLAAAWRAAHYPMRDIKREVAARMRADASSCWDLLNQVYAESGTPSRVARRNEALCALATCLSQLSESHRQVIRLRFLEGLPLREVATRLGRSEGAVVALTKRALVSLRESMDRLGDFTRGA
jgi:RNA polymerase sigma-70 factor (ECF subfamily)